MNKKCVFDYIVKDKHFYAKIPYDTYHFKRVLNISTLAETTKMLEEFVEDNKMIKVKGEYMLHPLIAKNEIYVNAFNQ